ncbi:MAG: ATP-binding protein [Deltaproteobacteria bacterium]|nr:ATP-binding protein [Deltaproteobacteria bacterium]
MTSATDPIRIAIVVKGRNFLCQEEVLPFSLEGYPAVDIVLYGTRTDIPADGQVHLLSELQPEEFDLILDRGSLVGAETGFSSNLLANLIAGPAAPFLKDLVCQLQTLRQKQEINTGVINSATDALVTINEDHVIVGFNLEAERMFGYSREEALGQDLKLIVPPPFTETHSGFLKRYLATREAHVLGRTRRLAARRRDGEEFTLSISFSVAKILGRLYFTAIMRDVTEYKAMEDRLLQTERLAAVGNTVAHIAHEIKNPLLIIGGFARQLQKVPQMDDQARHKLSIIAEEVGHLEKMVAEMRDFVRRPPIQKRPGQIKAAIQQAVELFEDLFQEHQVQVYIIEKSPLPTLSFDPQQMHEVLINLLKNAVEAMPRGGEITIVSRVRGSLVEIRISDTGEGIPREVAANIFRPYFTTKEKGTGLGLAICQSIIQEHGGTLMADSTPGRGSTFTIQLPLEEILAEVER